MKPRLPYREAPTVRELLSRATWADLDRIAARYAVTFGGRRRDLAVDRLAGLLERPDQLQAAERLLPDSTRAVLGLLMLLGAVDDERALAHARDRLVAARPELVSAFGRVHLPNELQTLTSLGLCFIDRRRVVVPGEVLRALPCRLPVATAGGEPSDGARSYAELAYLLNTLLAALGQETPVAALGQRTAIDHGAVYQPLLLTPEVAVQLGHRLQVSSEEAVLLLALLEAVGSVAAVRGRWQVQQEWLALSEQSPAALLANLVEAWQQPRALPDLSRATRFVWRCAPDADCSGLVAQHEASVRVLVWRWLWWSGGASISIDSFCQTFAALHPQLLQSADERGAWVAPRERGQPVVADDTAAVARVWLRQLLQQLQRLGIISLDEASCALSPAGMMLLRGTSPEHAGPVLATENDTTLRVAPLAIPPRALRLVELAGRMLPPVDGVARYEIDPVGLSRLQAHGVTVDTFIRELTTAGADLGPEFIAMLRQSAARTGRVRLHRPLSVLLTTEDAPLQQILAAAGVADAAEIVGPGCALIEPDRLDAAIEQLRARGFWPTTWASNGDLKT